MYRDGAFNENYSPDIRGDAYQMNPNPRGRSREEELEHADAMYMRAAPRREDPVVEKLEIDHGETQFADLERQLRAPPPEDDVQPQSQLRQSKLSSSVRPRSRKDSHYDSYEHSSRDSSLSSGNTEGKRMPASSLQKGYREARHIAGGMIHHPSESTEHYSILRHSHGLVFYKGINTYVAVSTFADTPLPQNRTYWLKAKNWSITAKNKATFRQQTNDLLNVTPAVAITAEQIDADEERAWERDIAQFEGRTRRGYRSKHILRETVVVRIPTESGDGYFQIVLSAGESRDAVCVSPAFRVLSVSPNMGGVSGAHWSTLPFEIGAMALSWQARSALVAAAIVPVKSAAKSKSKPFINSHATEARKATKIAYGATGAADKVGQQIEAFNNRYNQDREAPFSQAFKIDDDYNHGPKQPYPIRFSACCNAPHNEAANWHIILPIKLDSVAEIVTNKLCGYYFGWCSFPLERPDIGDRVHPSSCWYQAIIIVHPIEINKLERVTMAVASQKEVHIQILAGDREQPVNGTVAKVEVFGCIRPWDQELESILSEDMRADEELAFETAITNEASDIEVTRSILDHPSWSPETVAQKEEEEAAEPKPKVHGVDRLKQEYAAKRLAVQKRIDKVPAHMLGVRMPIDRMKDKSVVMNGYYIKR